MNEYTPKMNELWSRKVADKGFVRIPFLLLKHHRDLGLTLEDLFIIEWISFHQRSQKPAFPHPAKMANALGISNNESVNKLVNLKHKGYLALEKTKNHHESGNYYQDIRLVRSMLANYVKKIDGSIKNTETTVDASIPNRNVRSIDEVLKSRDSSGSSNA